VRKRRKNRRNYGAAISIRVGPTQVRLRKQPRGDAAGGATSVEKDETPSRTAARPRHAASLPEPSPSRWPSRGRDQGPSPPSPVTSAGNRQATSDGVAALPDQAERGYQRRGGMGRLTKDHAPTDQFVRTPPATTRRPQPARRWPQHAESLCVSPSAKDYVRGSESGAER